MYGQKWFCSPPLKCFLAISAQTPYPLFIGFFIGWFMINCPHGRLYQWKMDHEFKGKSMVCEKAIYYGHLWFVNTKKLFLWMTNYQIGFFNTRKYQWFLCVFYFCVNGLWDFPWNKPSRNWGSSIGGNSHGLSMGSVRSVRSALLEMSRCCEIPLVKSTTIFAAFLPSFMAKKHPCDLMCWNI